MAENKTEIYYRSLRVEIILQWRRYWGYSEVPSFLQATIKGKVNEGYVAINLSKKWQNQTQTYRSLPKPQPKSKRSTLKSVKIIYTRQVIHFWMRFKEGPSLLYARCCYDQTWTVNLFWITSTASVQYHELNKTICKNYWA